MSLKEDAGRVGLDFNSSIKLLFAGCVLSLVAVVFIIYFLMNSITDIANRQDALRSTRAMEAAMNGERKKLVGILADNAVWSETVRNAYGTPNTDWLQNNWGNSIDKGLYDVVMLLDSDGTALWHKVRRGLEGRFLSDYTGFLSAAFIQPLPRDGAHYATITDFFYYKGRMIVVSVAPIVPEKNGDTPPVRRRVFWSMPRLLTTRN